MNITKRLCPLFRQWRQAPVVAMDSLLNMDTITNQIRITDCVWVGIHSLWLWWLGYSQSDFTERLPALKQCYELVRVTFPTWPLQVVEMRRFALALLLPALISLLPALFTMFTK